MTLTLEDEYRLYQQPEAPEQESTDGLNVSQKLGQKLGGGVGWGSGRPSTGHIHRN